ncbi:hypothetical protein ABB37_09840 [Leptomonas pyrrhocoris]|uniref:Uncharacterized protein n=1 Tax=Leptomonas pyrrhocoris TaxID=157538 RepID=A0A0N0DQU5_LEPPY|nr:hypothetical protein ABB37_09840 [Leptomonas pyrrhocoris]KPA73534.1 hypothetical protein ABB37_09840 [Leptomonas pyrrhocoris]|eukprot:XP_015651973.1 hypothetical protein ABB37_09840 [Leptomonas pyrrhocoris]
MFDQWKMDLESEDHRARRDMTEKSIARYIKGDTERQVTSSSTSNAVFVSDCTCIMGASVAQPSYLCCGLSNGSVCLLNTANLSKIYLFEVDRDPRAASRDAERRGSTLRGSGSSAAQQLVAVATHMLAPSGSTATAAAAAGQLLLCMTLDSVVCVCPMDLSTVLERKKVSRSDVTKVKPYPLMKSASVRYSIVQFNPKGNRIAAVLGVAQEDGPTSPSTCSDVRHCVAVLTSTDAAVTLQSQFACEREWHTLAPPTTPTAATDAPALKLRYCGWWSADVLVCLWSNSCVQLLRAGDMAVVGECRLLRHCAADAVTSAAVSRPSGAEASESLSSNIVALVLDHNVAATFYVTSKKAVSAEAPDLKRARSELPLSLSITPTLQTYCTEEIPIREAYLFRSFSWTLLLLLESGALVFLDVETMKLSVHRAVNRLRAPDVDRYRARASLALPRHYFCVVNGKPFTAAIIEYNAAVMLKSQ